MKNIIKSNASIRVENCIDDEKSMIIKLTELEIENKTQTIDNFLKVVYLLGESISNIEGECDMCGAKSISGLAKYQLKVLGVWQSEGHYKIKFKTLEEREIFSAIIKVMRELGYHGESTCSFCRPPLVEKDLDDEFEILLALEDVKKMYAQQSEVENLR